MQSCKQQILEKDAKISQISNTIKHKEDILAAKMDEMGKLAQKLRGQPECSQMKSYIFSSKLQNLKKEIRRLRNEKLNLEANEDQCRKELYVLKSSVKSMNKRQKNQTKAVKSLEKQVGSISAKINDEIEKHSVAKSSNIKLQTYLNKGKEAKEKLLKEVNSRKKKLENVRYKNLDTKTMRPIDWNQIDESSVISKEKYSWIDDKSIEKSQEDSKLQDYIEDQPDFSLISFDPD